MPADPFGVSFGFFLLIVGAVVIWRPRDVAAMNRKVLPGKISGLSGPVEDPGAIRVGGLLGMIWGLAWLVLCWNG